MVVFAANARRAPPHAVGRSFSSSTPRRVAGGGFGTSCLPYSTPVVRSPCALRPVENRPTAHGARARCRTWRGCLRGHRATRSTPRRWPRLFFTDTASRRRLRLRNVVATVFDSRGARPRALPRRTSRRPTEHVRAGGLGVVVFSANAWHAHPTLLTEALLHRHRARSAAAASYRREHRVRLPWRAARARFAPWRTSRPPTEHTRAGGLGVVVFAANARRAPPHAVGRGFSSSTLRQVAGGGFGTSCLPYSTPVVRSPCALRPVENRPTAHGACARCRTWRGCLRGHRATRSTPRRWPRLFFTDTASRRRLRLRHVTKPRSAPVLRDPRALRPVENQADGPHSTCALADFGVVVFAANARRAPLHAVDRGSSSSTPRQVGGCGFETSWLTRAIPVARGPCAPRSRGEPADRPRSTCALADLAWLSSRPTRDVLHPTPLAEAFLHRHRAGLPAAASERRAYHIRLPWRAAHARFAPWRTGRRPTSMRSLSDLA